MTARLAALLALTTAATAAQAQIFTHGQPSIGDALAAMDRMHGLRSGAGRPAPRGLHQTFVFPERPGQNQVSWYDFSWQFYDVPSPSGGKGGIRLYYYGRERTVAERALPVIRNAYLRLVDQFHYTPTRQIPYILYSSEREFQATNIFQISEGTLGVTSPRDLKMSLPYFGNHELFREVSTHEMVHQFMIQKLLDLAGEDSYASPFDTLPLWFTEGIAEYYAKGGMDPETDLFLRDLVWNPDPEQHYEVVSFQEDRFRGYIPTYKLGQARVAFIAEVYGKERIQSFIENATLVGGGPGAFAALTARVLGEPLEQVDTRWRAWLRQRYYPQYLQTRQDMPQLRELQHVPAEVESFTVSPDARLVFYRGIDRDAGRAKLFLMDPRYPRGALEIAADDQPGIESLHPIEHSVIAISRDTLAFSAQSGPGDVLYAQPYRYQPGTAKKAPVIVLGARRQLPVRHPGGRTFIEISDPTFSPDGRELAFVGLTETGQLDIYVVSSQGGTARQVTHDPYAERDLSWGKDGIYCASDATDHGRFNLFRIDPIDGGRTRLTTTDANDGQPRPQPDGTLLFTSWVAGKPDIYLLSGGQVRRVTDFTTGLTSPATSAQARGIWAATFYRGRFRLVEVPRIAWLDEGPQAVVASTAPASDIPLDELPAQATPYDAFRWGNWRPEAGIVYGGGGAGAVAGRAAVLFADVLRDRLLYVDLTVYGSFNLTQGLALFQDRSRRVPWSLGVYHWVQSTVDPSDTNLSYFQRDFGAVGVLTYPLDRFRRFELEMKVGAIQRYCLTGFSVDVLIDCSGAAPANAQDWEQRNGGVNPQIGPAVRFGYDNVRLDPYTGPLTGESLLLELGGNYLPWRSAVNGFFRTDMAKFFQIVGRMKFGLRLGLGASFAPNDAGETWERTWWVSSADNLRGYEPLDLAFLVGTHYYVANAELQFPLSPIVNLPLFDYLEGVLAMDFGGVFDRWSSIPGASVQNLDLAPSDFGAWDTRTLTAVLGVNMIFGPLLLRLHFGHPFDIGGIQTPALRSGSSWVTNLTLRYLFF
jgi:hypothetical protein